MSGGLVKRIDLERHHVIRIGDDVVVYLKYESGKCIKTTVQAPADHKISIKQDDQA